MTNLITKALRVKTNYIIICNNPSDKKNFDLCLRYINGIVNILSKHEKIMVIGNSNTAEIVSNFTNDTEKLLSGIKLISYKASSVIGIYPWAKKEEKNLKSALEIAFANIDSTRENVVMVITDELSKDDKQSKDLITSMTTKGIKFYNIGVGISKENMDEFFVQQRNYIFQNYLEFSDKIKELVPQTIHNPIGFSVSPTKNSIQKSSKDFSITFSIFSKINKPFLPNGVIINFEENEYYFPYKVENEVSFDRNPCELQVILKVKDNCDMNEFPNFIKFNMEVNKIKYNYKLSIPFFWLSEDYVTDFPINIYVDGVIGHGKSSVLNLLFNLFTTGKIDYTFFYSSKQTGHTTKGIHFNPIHQILEIKNKMDKIQMYEEIINKIKINLVDKAGITSSNNLLDYSLAVEGKYHPGDYIKENCPMEMYKCHAVIFVCSMNIVSNYNEVQLIKKKINECSNNIQPILVVTHSDHHSEKDQLRIKKEIMEKLPVQGDNIFYVVPYINDITVRNSSKDSVGWRILKKALDISKATLKQEIKKNSFLLPDQNSQESSSISSPIQSNVTSPDKAANEKPQNIFTISVDRGGVCNNFKVARNTKIGEFYETVSKNLNITSKFSILDSDKCCFDLNLTFNDLINENQTNLFIKEFD
ncbi:hypothetical protein DICPUDRAFT_79848 [Dictyostelium purpureum]|uniref:Uncharacterized protein n=1 Tax=Dictyostelium purpureum TaxID=5786 RepID=F0ZNT3_DICPU|nr:uncharacterized protein DICPUDRAFT_79848 [Dictyostelium purpureum]EGC34393.1 hypothetical protein DICPUDRAFT_79848 [Dictyostelium purpureum]|eukprot:XP_003289067.1 hypothetical protein DICPUDRAFT_79848 [Dictyostelium purpureum]